MREYELDKGVYTSSLAVFSDTHGKTVDESYRHDPSEGFLSSYERTKWEAHYDVALPMSVRGVQYAWGYVDDVAHGHLLALDRGVVGESYIICGPVHGWVEAMDLAEELTGIPAPRLRMPAWLVSAMASVAGAVRNWAWKCPSGCENASTARSDRPE